MNDYDAYAEIWANPRIMEKVIPTNPIDPRHKNNNIFSLDYFREIDCYIRHWLFMPRMESPASMKIRWRKFKFTFGGEDL